jgi:hypothetical protein
MGWSMTQVIDSSSRAGTPARTHGAPRGHLKAVRGPAHLEDGVALSGAAAAGAVPSARRAAGLPRGGPLVSSDSHRPCVAIGGARVLVPRSSWASNVAASVAPRAVPVATRAPSLCVVRAAADHRPIPGGAATGCQHQPSGGRDLPRARRAGGDDDETARVQQPQRLVARSGRSRHGAGQTATLWAAVTACPSRCSCASRSAPSTTRCLAVTVTRT